jgi:hypothetical protein
VNVPESAFNYSEREWSAVKVTVPKLRGSAAVDGREESLRVCLELYGSGYLVLGTFKDYRLAPSIPKQKKFLQTIARDAKALLDSISKAEQENIRTTRLMKEHSVAVESVRNIQRNVLSQLEALNSALGGKDPRGRNAEDLITKYYLSTLLIAWSTYGDGRANNQERTVNFLLAAATPVLLRLKKQKNRSAMREWLKRFRTKPPE